MLLRSVLWAEGVIVESVFPRGLGFAGGVRVAAEGNHKGRPRRRIQPPLTEGTMVISTPGATGVASPPV